ncbi:hypothetical protein D3C73_1135110 [compost metagenome]
MALRPSTAASRRLRYTSTLSRTKDWSPFSAATAAAWLMDDGHDDVWDCSLFMAAIRGAGPTPYPSRQPVIAYALDTPLTSKMRSLSAGAAVTKLVTRPSPKWISS